MPVIKFLAAQKIVLLTMLVAVGNACVQMAGQGPIALLKCVLGTVALIRDKEYVTR
jgi:hypothetical protein